jgi:hypothetical protein
MGGPLARASAALLVVLCGTAAAQVAGSDTAAQHHAWSRKFARYPVTTGSVARTAPIEVWIASPSGQPPGPRSFDSYPVELWRIERGTPAGRDGRGL